MMADAGCGQSRCCFDYDDQISACWHWSEIVGFTYDGDMSPVHHDDCWTGISLDPGESDQTGCRKCDNGCHGFEDDLVNLFLSALWVDGKSYLRSQDARFGRDAKNRVFDLPTNTPTLIQRQCRLEHGSCYENNPLTYGGWVCWGHHVCQCTPEPDWSDPCPGPPPVSPGYPVFGLTPDIFFFNYDGWPPGGGTGPHSELFCRKWYPANAGASPRNTPITPYLPGGGGVHGVVYNATFLRSREGLNVDALVPCAGRVAESTCDNPTDGDCTYGERPVGSRINTQASSQGEFDELWIDLPSVDIRMRDFPSLSKQQLREHQLYQDIFSEAIVADGTGRVYPDTEVGSITMDRVEMPISANYYIGYYDRWFKGRDWTEADLPRIIEFPYCRTRWGNVPITAYMVITYCKIIVNLTVPHFARYVRGVDPNEHWIKPFATVEIHVHTAMLCDPVTTGITVGGVPVVVTNPTWIPGQGYDGIPTATPDGNEIIYARELEPERRPGTGATRTTGRPLPVRVPRKWRWFGRLGSFSDPVTTKSDFDYANMNCEDLIDVIGTVTVPALATANESHPEDPNRNYAGSIAFHFQSTG